MAKDGNEALEIFHKESIDIIITDINMPKMGGAELIQAIQKNTDKEPIIIVLSAYNDSKLLTGLINLGVNYFLNKPLDKQLMINALYKACKIINDRKLLLEYESKLYNELVMMERKHKILEQKLNQLAIETNKNIQATSQDKKSKVIKTDNYFSAILSDDREELEDLSAELENYITMMFQNEQLNEDYLFKLSNVYKKYASLLKTYPEFFDISTSLHELSETILKLEQKFMKDISQTGIYFESLQLTLENYKENVWNKKAKNPKFYNASLRNDIQLVIDFLEDKEAKENEIEFF
jgi:CheY-like chemotaxis protein